MMPNMLQPITGNVLSVADKNNPLDEGLNKFGLTEGAGVMGTGGGSRSYANPGLVGARAVRSGEHTYSVRPGVDFTGKEHAVIDRRTGQVVGAFKNRSQARAMVDRLDNNHGSYISNQMPLSWLEKIE
jgi:hypothetical protein